MTTRQELSGYIIKGGSEGRARLSVLAQVLEPTTNALLDRFSPLAGALVLDAGCGGGDVSLELARRVGSGGRVIGFDLDEEKLAAAAENARLRALGNVTFTKASVVGPWPASGAALIYVRFVLTHLAQPERLLDRAMLALAPGGVLVVEDIDFAGHFCDPPCPAFDRYVELYTAVAAARGADACIGRRLVGLLEGAGFDAVGSALVQPFGRSGEVKQMASLTFAAIGDSVVSAGLAPAAEVERLRLELHEHAARPDTTQSMPRIFQAWGCKPAVPA